MFFQYKCGCIGLHDPKAEQQLILKSCCTEPDDPEYYLLLKEVKNPVLTDARPHIDAINAMLRNAENFRVVQALLSGSLDTKIFKHGRRLDALETKLNEVEANGEDRLEAGESGGS